MSGEVKFILEKIDGAYYRFFLSKGGLDTVMGTSVDVIEDGNPYAVYSVIAAALYGMLLANCSVDDLHEFKQDYEMRKSVEDTQETKTLRKEKLGKLIEKVKQQREVNKDE